MLSKVNKTDFLTIAFGISVLTSLQIAFKLADSLYLLFETKLWMLYVGIALSTGFLCLVSMSRRFERDQERIKQKLEAELEERLDKYQEELREYWEFRLVEKEKWVYLRESQSNRRVAQAEKTAADLRERLNNLLEKKREKQNKTAQLNHSRAAERIRKKQMK